MKNAATAIGAPVGFDAGKLVKGCKRLVLTGTLGNVLASSVVPANAADGPAAIAFRDEVAAHDLLGRAPVVFVDTSFNGVFREHLAHRYGVRVEKPAHVPVQKNELLHSRLALNCRAHVRVAQCEPQIVKGVRPQFAPCQRLDLRGQHSEGAQVLLTQTAS